jgi:hypothetical protein
MRFIFALFLFVFTYSQAVVLTANCQIKQSNSETKSQTFDRAKALLRYNINVQLKALLSEQYGLSLPIDGIKDYVSKSKEISFLVSRSEWVAQRLFVTAEYKFDLVPLIRELDQFYSNLLKAASFEEKSLQFSLDRIRKTRDQYVAQRIENTDTVMSILKIGLHRADVLKLLLMLTERKIGLDLNSVKFSHGNTEYSIKNTYIRIHFNKNGYVENLFDDRPINQR